MPPPPPPPHSLMLTFCGECAGPKARRWRTRSCGRTPCPSLPSTTPASTTPSKRSGATSSAPSSSSCAASPASTPTQQRPDGLATFLPTFFRLPADFHDCLDCFLLSTWRDTVLQLFIHCNCAVPEPISAASTVHLSRGRAASDRWCSARWSTSAWRRRACGPTARVPSSSQGRARRHDAGRPRLSAAPARAGVCARCACTGAVPAPAPYRGFPQYRRGRECAGVVS